jgi:hypothetical protein
VKITENKPRRAQLFQQLLSDRFKGGWPHQHELWPCVRLGVAQRFLGATGMSFGTRKRALYWLRGQSAEALIIGVTTSLVKHTFVYEGVIVSPDRWLGEPDLAFDEIKSTALSSARLWPTVKAGEAALLSFSDIAMHSYYEQCAIYCVATGTSKCGLIIYFLHGDYAERRKKCPEPLCGGTLGPFQEDGLYKQCNNRKCPAVAASGEPYKSYSMDLRAYDLEFSARELAWFHEEVYANRKGQFAAGMQAKTAAGIRKAAKGTKNFYCSGCEPGRLIECENYNTGSE